jgi:hypothetical protein
MNHHHTTISQIAAAVLVAVGLTVAVGCGGGGSSASKPKSTPAAASSAGYRQKAYALLKPVVLGRRPWYDAKTQKEYRTALTGLELKVSHALAGLNGLKPPAQARDLHSRTAATLAKFDAGLKAQLARPKIATAPAGDVVNIGNDVEAESNEFLTLP